MSDLKEKALHYHQYPRPGKFEITPTKSMSSQRDLALAYSPGVAEACHAIVEDEANAAKLTLRSNLVAVVSNGTAVLGLGNIGPLASKPVMEGKAVLFKKFAGVDVFDIEIQENDPDKLIDIIASLEPTFGAINLEDIKAPECFYIEEELKKRLKIPVFHDDQHGTAIIVGAFVTNALQLVKKDLKDIKLVCSGAGAAAIACVDILVELGLRPENVLMLDTKSVLYQGRPGLTDPSKLKYAAHTEARTLDDAIAGADMFLGVSVGGILTKEMVKKMAANPVIMALANPNPEILPEDAKSVRDDVIIATGRSDYPNQVNNVLCFPFIFRGALDVGAVQINTAMKMACVSALANLAKQEIPDVVAAAYGDEHIAFGVQYLIPKPFDPRLVVEIPLAVAKAAMESGVATRPIEDWEAYKNQLMQYVFRSGVTMKPIIDGAKNLKNLQRIVYTDGEEPKVLRAVQTVVDDGLARPILIGRKEVILARIKHLGLRLRIDQDFLLCDPSDDPRYKEYWSLYYSLMARNGVSPAVAKAIVRTNPTVIGALMVHKGEADALIVGPVGRFCEHVDTFLPILGSAHANPLTASMDALITSKGTYFICDTRVNVNPSVEELVKITLMAADQVKRFGLVPKVALLSHSNFGSYPSESAMKMQQVYAQVKALDPYLEIDGEMQADAALDMQIRQHVHPDSTMIGTANLLIMPNLDAAHISFTMAKVLTDGEQIGPILLGMSRPVHILSPSVSTRSIVNISALTAVECVHKV